MAGRPIDEKIVAMKMDNSDFKSKAIETTSLFGKLQSALNKIPGINLGKTTQDLQGIQNAANNTNLNALQRAADTVGGKFSAMGVVAITALSNITNKAVDAGLELGKSLSVEPIMDGFHEYETKIGSIATVLSNTQWDHTTLKDVNAALQDLNTYSDKTIYNFGQMTENIGRFTAAGVSLGDSTIAIKGLGNLAAASGATSDQLNSAMYQMSQALASGKLNLQDWNSLVNSGMAGKKTQDALVATARAMGKNVNLSQGFRNSIQKGWLTSKVFLETLKKFGKDKSLTAAATKVRTLTSFWDTLKESIGSGWATSFELMLGNFDQATNRFTALSNALNGVVQQSAKNRNYIIKNLANAGVFNNIFKVITNLIIAFAKIFEAVSSGFTKAFPPANLRTMKGIANGIQTFAKSLIPSAATLKTISTVAHGLGSIIRTVAIVAIGLGKALIGMVPPGTGTAILNLITYLGQVAIGIAQFIQRVATSKDVMNAMSTIFSIVSVVLKDVISGVVYLGRAFVNMIPKDLGDRALKVVNYVARLITSFGQGVKGGNNLHKTAIGLGGVLSVLGIIVGSIGRGFSKFGDIIVRTGKSIGSYLNSISVPLDPIQNGFKSFFKALVSGFDWVKEKIKDIGVFIKDHMPSGQQLVAGGFVAGLATIAWKVFKLGKGVMDAFLAWAKIGEGIKEILHNASEVLESVSGALNAFAMQVKAQALLTIAFAVGVLAISLLVLSRLNGTQIAEGIGAIAGSIAALVGAMAIMTKFDITGTGIKAAIQIVALSIAFSILAGSLKKISNLNWSEISRGIVGLVGVMGTFSGAMAIMGRFGGKKIEMTALQMVGMAVAIRLMLSVIKGIATINIGTLTKGVTTMGIILLEVGAFMKLAGGGKFGIGATLGMLAVGRAIKNIASAIQDIAKIDVNNLKVGLTTITIILTEIALFAKLTNDMGLLSAGIGILGVATAIAALVIPVSIFGSMNLATLAKGLGAIAVALFSIAGASMLATGMVAMGGGLMLLAAGLTMLLVPLLVFAAIGWKPMLIGMAGLALTLLILGGSALLLSEAIPSLVAFGLGVLALGAGLALAGVGIMAFGVGLATLAGMTISAITAIIGVLGTFIVGLASLIPVAVDFIVKLVMQIANAIATNAPQLMDKVGLLIVEIINGLAKWLPPMIQAAVDFIVKLINGMAKALDDNGQNLINAVMRLIGEILVLVVESGVALIEALFGWIPGVKGAAESIGKTATKTIRDTFGASQVGSQKGTDFANGLSGKSGDAHSAGTRVSQAGKKGAESTNLKSTGDKQGQQFVSGLSDKIKEAESSGKKLADSGKKGAHSVDMTSTGSWFGQGFINGMGSKVGSVIKAAEHLASSAANTVSSWLDINSPSKVAHGLGGWFGEGLALGISDKTKRVGDSSKGLAITAKDSLNQFLDGFELPASDNELHFKAVVDYDKLDTSKFGNLPALSVGPDTSLTSKMVAASSQQSATNVINQNGSNSEIIKRQEQQIDIMQKQIDLLSSISNKDNSTYLDSKEIYNGVKKVQNSQTNIRNIFKGVSRV